MKKYFWLVVISIFAVPLAGMIPVRGATLWYPQYIAFLSLAFLAVSLVLWNFNKAISLFSIACLLNTMLVTGQQPNSFFVLTTIYLACFTIRGISLFSKKQRRYLLWAIVGLFFLQALMVTLQYFNLDPIFNHIKDASIDDTVGLVGSRNQMGLFFAIVSPIIVYLIPLAIPLLLFCIFCSTTTTTWIACIVGILFYTFVKKKEFFIFTGIILILANGLFYNKFESMPLIKLKERLYVSRLAIEQVNQGYAIIEIGNEQQKIRKEITCNKWFGFGLGNFMKIAPYTQFKYLKGQHRYFHAHNDYIEFFFEFGYIAIPILLLLLGSFLKDFITTKKTDLLVISFACILIHMVSALGIFTVQTAVSGMLLVINLGIFYGEVRNGKKRARWSFTQMA